LYTWRHTKSILLWLNFIHIVLIFICYKDTLTHIYVYMYICTKIDQMNINIAFIVCICIHITFICTLKQCRNKYSCMFLVRIKVLLEWMSGFYHMIPLSLTRSCQKVFSRVIVANLYHHQFMRYILFIVGHCHIVFK